ncbi:MAG: hypothetical protein ACP5QO_15905 [Clostridia bacterium]
MALRDTYIDYTEAVARDYGLSTYRCVRADVALLAAHGHDTDVLLLERLPDLFIPGRWQPGRYYLEYRWLTQPCGAPDDEA